MLRNYNGLFLKKGKIMSHILSGLGIYGWKGKDENLLLGSLLTGDPLLLIGTHGTAKTGMVTKIAEALDLART